MGRSVARHVMDFETAATAMVASHAADSAAVVEQMLALLIVVAVFSAVLDL